VQIPKELLDELHLSGNKLKLEMHDGKIVITSPEASEAPKFVEDAENH